MAPATTEVTERLKQWVGEKTWQEVTWLVEEDRNKLRQAATVQRPAPPIPEC